VVHRVLVRWSFRGTRQSQSFLTSAGRTTFVNTLCGKKVLSGKDADDATNAHVEEGVQIKPVTVGMLLLGYWYHTVRWLIVLQS